MRLTVYEQGDLWRHPGERLCCCGAGAWVEGDLLRVEGEQPNLTILDCRGDQMNAATRGSPFRGTCLDQIEGKPNWTDAARGVDHVVPSGVGIG
jgi:hypothetical protein